MATDGVIRRLPGSNRRAQLCRLVPNHSAKAPLARMMPSPMREQEAMLRG